MTVSIRQIGPCFAGEVSGADLTKPLSREEVAAIEAGMVVHDRSYDGNLVHLTVAGPASLMGRFREYRLRDK